MQIIPNILQINYPLFIYYFPRYLLWIQKAGILDPILQTRRAYPSCTILVIGFRIDAGILKTITQKPRQPTWYNTLFELSCQGLLKSSTGEEHLEMLTNDIVLELQINSDVLKKWLCRDSPY